MLRRGQFWLAAALCAGLAGCGFQLAESEGVATGISQKSLQIIGGDPEFRPALLRRLRSIGVRVVSGEAAADLIVHLDGPKKRRRVIGVTTGLENRRYEMDAREYEIELNLRVSLQAPGGEPRPPTTLTRQRHWLFDPFNRGEGSNARGEGYLAAEEERRVLEREMREDLIEGLLLYIRTQS